MYNRWFPYWPDWHVMKSFVSRRFPAMERPFMVGVPTASDWTEALLRSVTDSAPLGFFVVDNRTDAILYFNDLFCEIWNIQRLEGRLRRGELKNSDIIPDCLPLVKDVPAFVESCKPLQSEENRAVVEDEVGFVDGRTVRRFSTQIRDVDDRYFGRLYVFEDITARKRAEQALAAAHRQLETRVKERTKALEETNSALEKEVAERRLAEEVLRRSEEQLRALFDNSPDFTLTLDQRRRHPIHQSHARGFDQGAGNRKLLLRIHAGSLHRRVPARFRFRFPAGKVQSAGIRDFERHAVLGSLGSLEEG